MVIVDAECWTRKSYSISAKAFTRRYRRISCVFNVVLVPGLAFDLRSGACSVAEEEEAGGKKNDDLHNGHFCTLS